jgi:hypothetical protein
MLEIGALAYATSTYLHLGLILSWFGYTFSSVIVHLVHFPLELFLPGVNMDLFQLLEDQL